MNRLTWICAALIAVSAHAQANSCDAFRWLQAEEMDFDVQLAVHQTGSGFEGPVCFQTDWEETHGPVSVVMSNTLDSDVLFTVLDEGRVVLEELIYAGTVSESGVLKSEPGLHSYEVTINVMHQTEGAFLNASLQEHRHGGHIMNLRAIKITDATNNDPTIRAYRYDELSTHRPPRRDVTQLER